MRNFALGAFVSLLVAAAALQALAQSSDEQRGGDPPASADGPGTSPDACKPDGITALGVAKYRRSTLEKELGGEGSAMANAVREWEKQAGAAFGERWKAWSKATERSLGCSHGVLFRDRVICNISGRPCESETVTAAADKSDPSPPPLANAGPHAPAAPNAAEQAASDAPRCYGVIAAVGGQATSKGAARRAAEDTWMDRIMFDFGERYVDLSFAEDVKEACGPSTPVSPALIIKKVYFRCKIWARPCRPPDGVMAKIKQRYEEEDAEFERSNK
jgi:hypothetical protein